MRGGFVTGRRDAERVGAHQTDPGLCQRKGSALGEKGPALPFNQQAAALGNGEAVNVRPGNQALGRDDGAGAVEGGQRQLIKRFAVAEKMPRGIDVGCAVAA